MGQKQLGQGGNITVDAVVDVYGR